MQIERLCSLIGSKVIEFLSLFTKLLWKIECLFLCGSYRCDLLVTANGKTEKIATGLLDPFLVHLKTAKDQLEKGGYSIILKPEASDNAAWFTKGTVERSLISIIDISCLLVLGLYTLR